MKNPTRFLLPSLLSALLLLVASGCSREAKKARYLSEADRLLAEGKYEEAEINYKNVLQIEGLNPQAIKQLGIIYADEGRTGRAIAFIMKGHELLPEDLELRLKIGQRELSAGKLKEAQAQANYILDRRPEDPEAPFLLSAALASPTDASTARDRLLSLPPPAPSKAPVLAALGMIEFRLQHLNEAEALYRQALVADPKYATAHAALGLLLLAKNDPTGAEASLRQAAELSPLRSPRRLQYAQFKVRTNDLAGAKALLSEMTQKTPDYLPAWVALAQIAMSEKRYPEALQLVGKALARDQENVEARILNGQLNLAMNDFPKAIAEFEKLTATYPKMPAAHFELGRAYAASGDTSKAIDSLSQAVALAPGYVEAIIPLATLSIRKGDLSNAIVMLRKLIQQRPDLPLPRLLLADAYRGQGNFDDAVAIYEEVEQGAPKDPQASLLKGQVLMQQRKYDLARSAFTHAAELAPDNPAAPEQLVNLEAVEKNYAAAQQRAEAYSAKHPKEAGPYLWLAKVFLAQKDQARAEAVLKKAIDLQPEIPTPYYLLASLYFTANEHQKALSNLAELIAKNPKDKPALMLTGVLYDELKNHAAARDNYEKLLALDPKFSAALNNLAYLYSEHFNDLDRAQELAQRARELLPQEPHTADTLGWILYKKRQYPWAMALLAESAGKLPDSAEVQYHLGMTYYMLGNEEAARASLQRAFDISKLFNGADRARQCLALLTMAAGQGERASLEKTVAERTDDPVALARLAAVYEQAGATDKAIATNQAALKVSPGYVKVMLSLARLYSGQHDLEKAMEMAKAARKAAPLDADVASALGRVAFQSGDFPWATSLLQETVRRQPDNPETQFDFALAAYSVGRVAEARAALQTALDASAAFRRSDQARRMLELIDLAAAPTQDGMNKVNQALVIDASDVPALMARAALAEQKARSSEAKQSYEAALARYPDFTPAKRGLAILYAKTSEDDKRAYELATKARDAFSDDPDLTTALGIIVYRRGEFPRAASLLGDSASKKPNDAEVMFYLGMAQARLKDPSQSSKSLQRALDLGLKPDLAAQAKRALSASK